jgi:FkbM family methyltransferase
MILGIPSKLNKLIDNLFFRNKSCIRFGTKGYTYHVYPVLKNKGLVISGGVGEDIDFELDLYERYKSEILIFDPSQCAKEAIKKYGKVPIKYYSLGLSGKKENVKFGISSNGYISRGKGSKKNVEFNCESVSNIARKREIDLLKIDIEGSEYAVIEDILKNKVRVNQIVLEFHHWFKHIPLRKTIWAIIRLRFAGYILIKKNIDDYTFVKKELIK